MYKYLIHSKAQATMNYKLSDNIGKEPSESSFVIFKKLLKLIEHEKKNLFAAIIAIFFNALLGLLGPLIIGHTIDNYIRIKDFHGVLINAGYLMLIYLCALFTSYQQTKLMGGIGQRLLFTLRNSLFNKLQTLPVAFFNQNKAGDLISRLNNDTDKINQFFSQALIQFISSIVSMTGAGIFLMVINWKLGSASLVPAILILVFTKLVSSWVKDRNAISLKNTGGLSSEIQESLNNFKVIIAFNRRDYFRERFEKANNINYKSAISAGIANNIFLPIYSLFASIAQLIVLALGIYLISKGSFTIGLLVSYLAYTNSFYIPLRQLATLWASFQMAMAGWDRISQILSLESNLLISNNHFDKETNCILSFNDVSFSYGGGNEILHHINFDLFEGKTYAFVGPTGGGKTTTASLMARLFDPQSGIVFLNGKDIKTYSASERSKKIGFILQEPVLFSGTVKENIIYGNEKYADYDKQQLEDEINNKNLGSLLTIFEDGLDTAFTQSADNISLGQKQIIAFIRAVLRDPELIILDEATANIDTITEQLLEDILNKLPEKTTKVIIAHRLNTIQNADQIFFVNAGNVTLAGSFNNAIQLLLEGNNRT